VAVELKVGRFKAAYMGQMHQYLKWLERFDREEGEQPPIGLILCTEADRDQVELLELHKDNIVVAEYWTELLPKKELEARLQTILRDARERVARRALPNGSEKESSSMPAT
jgi:DNA-binding response OmpR family regulator